MAKKVKRKSAPKKYHANDDYNFIIIVGGGFIVILLSFFMMGGSIFGINSKSQTAKVQGSTFREMRVVIKDGVLTPEEVKVSRGTIVTWVNKDSSISTIAADDGSFNTGNLNQNESGSVTFEKSGTFMYHDEFNPSLTGTIIVK